MSSTARVVISHGSSVIESQNLQHRRHDVAEGVLQQLAASGRPCALYGAYCRGVGSAAVFFAALFGLLQQCDVAARRESSISDRTRRQEPPDAPRRRQVSESAICNAVFAEETTHRHRRESLRVYLFLTA